MRSKASYKTRRAAAFSHLSVAAAVAGLLALLAPDCNAVAATVNWLDPLGYEKPEPVDVPMPDEASAPKYYVDLASGSGNSCTQGVPCGIAAVAGKPGTAGGPAYIYLRGTGPLYLYNPSTSFYGGPGREIVLKAWPGYTATIAGPVNNLTGSNVHHWLFDGGPDMGIIFLAGTGNANVALRVNSNDHAFYRIRGTCKGDDTVIFMTTNGQANNLRIINSEFYGCDSGSGAQQQIAVYMGGSSCNDKASGFTNLLIQNNVIRDMGGDGIELNPRTVSSGATIKGNAFHNIGKRTCAGNWDCRPAITVDGPSCGGSSSNVVIANNLMWDIGGSCVWDKGGGNSALIYNNTCYNYGQGTSHGVCMEGVCGGAGATIRSNILYAPNGRAPFGSETNSLNSNNLCASGQSCGASKRNWSANTVRSTDPNSIDFMKPGPTSEARNNGYATPSVSYGGPARPPYDIGAFVGGAYSALEPPANLRVLPTAR